MPTKQIIINMSSPDAARVTKALKTHLGTEFGVDLTVEDYLKRQLRSLVQSFEISEARKKAADEVVDLDLT